MILRDCATFWAGIGLHSQDCDFLDSRAVWHGKDGKERSRRLAGPPSASELHLFAEDNTLPPHTGLIGMEGGQFRPPDPSRMFFTLGLILLLFAFR